MKRFALLCLTLAVSATISWTVVGADESDSSFPLQAMVIHDGAQVFSGPGAVHYPTDVLNQGDVVQVWRFDPGGWCAIRPVSGSFCLVPESGVERTAGDLGQVREAGLQAWVGTRLGPVEKPLWQVRMEVGEEVRILGEASWPNPEGFPSTWLQIEPPAGEFRWIHRDDLQLPDPATSLPGPDESTSGRTQQPANTFSVMNSGSSEIRLASAQMQQSGVLDDPFGGLPPPLVESRSNGSPNRSAFVGDSDSDIYSEMGRAGERTLPSLADEGWRPARQPIQLASGNPSGPEQPMEPGRWADRPERFASLGDSTSQMSMAAMQNQRNMLFEPNTNSVTAPTFGDQRLGSDLAAIDLQLATEIIKPPEYWDLDGIANALTRIQATATESSVKDQAMRLVRKVDDLRRTRANLVGSIAVPTVAAIASAERPVGSGLDTSIELGATYDAHGWLNELAQSNGQMEPTWVLQDNAGRITYHISPAPGLNLHRYVKSRVGIKGQRGYNQRLKLNHVTAESIIVLEPAASNTARRF